MENVELLAKIMLIEKIVEYVLIGLAILFAIGFGIFNYIEDKKDEERRYRK